MVYVLFNWLIIWLTSYSIGYATLALFMRCIGYRVGNNSVKITLAGIVVIGVYAEAFSLFGGVGIIAFILVALVALVCWIIYRRELLHCIRVSFSPFDEGRYVQAQSGVEGLSSIGTTRIVAYVLLLIIMAYGTSRGYMHYDTNLYHAQAIRWIEEYGVVPGLANLQLRFGYNSAEFALNALYGMKWLFGQSLHTTAGFFAFLSAIVALDLVKVFRIETTDGRKRLKIEPSIADYVRIGLIFYLGVIFSEMISPASDYYAQLLIFDVVIWWLELDGLSEKEEEERTLGYGLLCIFLVYAITVKLSIGLLVLLALKPTIIWSKEKNYRPVIVCLISGFVVALPYLIRNYIISGWLLYPSTLLSIGSPDWQVPKGNAQYDAKEISMWGRGINSAERWSTVTATNWIGDWIANLNLLEKCFVLATLLSIVILVIAIIIPSIYRLVRKAGHGRSEPVLPLVISLILGTVFWFVSAPLVRYGYAYLIIVPFMTIGYIMSTGVIQSFAKKSQKMSTYFVYTNSFVFTLLLALVLGMKVKGLIRDITRTISEDYYIAQQDYIDGEAFTYDVQGVTIYVAYDSGQIGYYKFPATPEEYSDMALRGKDISDGFVTIR